MKLAKCKRALALCFIIVAVDTGDAAPRTMAGPESAKLLPQASGYILMSVPPNGITAAALPSLKQTLVRPNAKEKPEDQSNIHALSGPDSQGRIAYFEGLNTPYVGGKDMLTLKLQGINTPDFQTVLPSIDPRRVISFGAGK